MVCALSGRHSLSVPDVHVAYGAQFQRNWGCEGDGIIRDSVAKTDYGVGIGTEDDGGNGM